MWLFNFYVRQNEKRIPRETHSFSSLSSYFLQQLAFFPQQCLLSGVEISYLGFSNGDSSPFGAGMEGKQIKLIPDGDRGGNENWIGVSGVRGWEQVVYIHPTPHPVANRNSTPIHARLLELLDSNIMEQYYSSNKHNG